MINNKGCLKNGRDSATFLIIRSFRLYADQSG